jgi:hypothetical protein
LTGDAHAREQFARDPIGEQGARLRDAGVRAEAVDEPGAQRAEAAFGARKLRSARASSSASASAASTRRHATWPRRQTITPAGAASIAAAGGAATSALRRTR